MKKFLSLIFTGLSYLMLVLATLLAFAGGWILVGVAFQFLINLITLFFEGKGFGKLQDNIQYLAPDFIKGIVLLGIAGICALLEKMFYAISNNLAPHKPQEAHSTSSSSTRSTSSSYTSSSSSYSGSDSYTDSSGSYDRKMHDELDALQYSIKITETYGEDWKGYDAEYSSPDPDPYSFGPDPESFPTDIW